jgi:prepilin-type N-terminal cleavage/methylation domain-containing protein
MTKRSPAFTLVEVLTVLAILATLVGLLIPAVMAAKDHAARVEAGEPEPPASVWMQTVQHDRHWFITRGEGFFLHHPNCPCRMMAEKE